MAAPSASRRALERRVCQYVRTFGLLHPGERLLLMLSGGPDSMALLQLVLHCERRLGLGLWLAALHVDYGLRGADSTRDRKIVEEACAAHGVELHVVEAPTGMRGANFQQRARDFRYAQARAVAMERGCARIVTAHNRDDQAETILYRLAKYPSPAVLAGMAPLDGDLARPLLCLDAEEVRDYCRLAGITFGEDVTNARPVYARNRLRLRVLPELRAVNPRLTEDLAAAAEIARQERELLDQLAEQAWRRALLQPEAAIESCESGSGSGGAVLELSVEVLQSEPTAVSAACLRRLAQAALGKRALITRRTTTALTGLLEGGGGRRVCLPSGWQVVREARVLRLMRPAAVHHCAPATVRVRAGAAERVAFCDAVYRLSLQPGACYERRTDAAWVAADGASAEVTLRHPRRGERFAPLGAGGTATVLQFLADHGVPAGLRARALVLEVDGDVAWVSGRVAESHRVTESTLFTLHARREA